MARAYVIIPRKQDWFLYQVMDGCKKSDRVLIWPAQIKRPAPTIAIFGHQANVTKLGLALAVMEVQSPAFRDALVAVGINYNHVQIFIGTGFDDMGQASSGQDATNPNTWNIYIDTRQTVFVLDANGSSRTAYVEEILAHEILHGARRGMPHTDAGFRQEEADVVRETNIIGRELFTSGDTHYRLAYDPINGVWKVWDHQVTSMSDPFSLRFSNGDVVDITNPMTGPGAVDRKPFSGIDEDGNLFIQQSFGDGSEKLARFAPDGSGGFEEDAFEVSVRRLGFSAATGMRIWNATPAPRVTQHFWRHPWRWVTRGIIAAVSIIDVGATLTQPTSLGVLPPVTRSTTGGVQGVVGCGASLTADARSDVADSDVACGPRGRYTCGRSSPKEDRTP